MTIVDRTTAVARTVRANLLRFAETPRDLAGQCGLAAMLVAAALERPAALRTGFYMKHGRGRLPNRHAWCCVAATIVDATATQFDARHRAVHVASATVDNRYIETARGADAIDDIMTNWYGRKLPAYVALAKSLRRRLGA